MRRFVFLVLFGLLLGAVLTGIAGALPGSHGLDVLTWLGTVSTVAASVVAVGIYRVQQTQSDVAHQELLDVQVREVKPRLERRRPSRDRRSRGPEST
ncbi:MAG: hypothetical protein WAL22_06695 [Solirubrobacteraceae bacterium]